MIQNLKKILCKARRHKFSDWKPLPKNPCEFEIKCAICGIVERKKEHEFTKDWIYLSKERRQKKCINCGEVREQSYITCPTCNGIGKQTISREDQCPRCNGHGIDMQTIAGAQCLGCDGDGTITKEVEEKCQKCDGKRKAWTEKRDRLEIKKEQT